MVDINWKDASDGVNKDTDIWLEIGEVGECTMRSKQKYYTYVYPSLKGRWEGETSHTHTVKSVLVNKASKQHIADRNNSKVTFTGS